MNESPYLISGLARRALKKELAELKSMIRYQPHCIDLTEVCGGYLDMELEEVWKVDAEERVRVIEDSLTQLNGRRV